MNKIIKCSRCKIESSEIHHITKTRYYLCTECWNKFAPMYIEFYKKMLKKYIKTGALECFGCLKEIKEME